MDGADPHGVRAAPPACVEPPAPVDVSRLREALRQAPELTATRGLDRITELACRLLGASGARVSLVGDAPVVVGSSHPRPPGVLVPADGLALATAEAGEPLVVEDAAADPRLAGAASVRSGSVRAYLGVPLRSPEGEVVGTLCVCAPQPRRWSDTDLATVRELAGSAVTELQLAALAADRETDRLRWGLAAEAARIGTWDWDLVTGRLTWDGRLVELVGYPEGAFDGTIEAFYSRLHPDDRERVVEALQAAIDTCGVVDVHFRAIRADDGRTLWLHGRGRALPGPTGRAARLVGAAYDATEEREAETRLARVLESMPACFVSLDPDWRFSYVNAQAERLMGCRREEVLGRTLWEAFPVTVGTPLERAYRRAVRTGETVTLETSFPTRDAVFEVRAWPGADGLSVYFVDVSDRHRAQRAAEHARARVTLLAAVDAGLSGARDGDAALGRLPRLVVPTLADGCIVTVVDREGRARDVGSWHADPARRDLLAHYTQVRLEAMPQDSPVARSLRLGSALSEEATAVRALMPPGPARDILDALGPDRAVVLPLTADERTVGVLTLYQDPGRVFGEEDMAVARQVAARAGRVVERVRWQSRQVQVAEALQRSLLGAPPPVPWADVAVRYVPATEAARVGGDWYDAFLQPRRAGGADDTSGDGRGDMVVVIGDVVGHDTEAAAAMGQLRALLRGIAHHSGAGPAEVLRGLDDAIAGMHRGTLATAAVARLERPGRAVPGAAARLRWANAGHPPPMVAVPDGGVRVLGADVGDLMLGVDPWVRRREGLLQLPPSSTLLLYTDGLVERRGTTLDEGTDRLRATLAELARCPVDELSDALLDRMLDGTPQDDVALVALRLTAPPGA